jgi:dipeptidyl aminopeptidase/acylaminoacyl peptidase
VERSISLMRVLCVAWFVVWSSVAHTETLPIEHFFRNAKFTDVELSPSGRYLAAVGATGKRDGLIVVDLEKKEGAIVAALNDFDVRGFAWVNDERLVYWLTDNQSGWGEQVASGLFAVDRDGKDPKLLAPTRDRGARVWRHPFFAGVVHDGSDDILVVAGDRDVKSQDAYRMNTRTAKKTLLTFENPGFLQNLIFDQQGVPRAAVGSDADGHIRINYVREKADEKWTEVLRWNPLKEDSGWTPIALDYDGTLYVSTRQRSNTSAIYRYDWAGRKIGEKLAGHNRYDIGRGLIIDGVKKKIVGVNAELDKQTTVWVDEQWATWQAQMDASLPGMVNRLQRGSSGQILVSSYSDRAPTTWFLFDPNKKSLEKVAESRPWIDSTKMAEQKFFQFTARDGMLIPAYLTTPTGRDAKNLPLVVLIHGGPNLRGETWHWQPQTQFLASRGYAVLQVDFRGSTGYGWKHFRAGWKQWGLAMQDDLTDGALHLVKEGIVDKSRMALMGGSYGGYATMQGLVREPDLFKCGVNIVGVTDLFFMHDVTWSDFAGSEGVMGLLRTRMGDPKIEVDREQLERTSPARNANRIVAPVLIAHGGQDRRVPIIHADTMRTALRKTGREPEWVVYPDEAHGFGLEANRYDLYGRIEKFLAMHLKP